MANERERNAARYHLRLSDRSESRATTLEARRYALTGTEQTLGVPLEEAPLAAG
jgi:hypothetical protein